jgi:hypothetical protein
MAWGKIDDGFDDHRKVVALLDEDDTAAAAVAIGLWTLCLTWAHRNTRKRGQTPGLLPAGLPKRFLGPIGKDAAQLLVKHKLWDAQDDGGWLIHDFDDYLPTDETRAARAEAGRRGAAKRWAKPPHDPTDPKPPSPDDGNLPSGSHDADSKPIANDGSRAPARRAISKEIAPTPTPIPIPPSAGESPPATAAPAIEPTGPPTAQTLIAEWIDHSRKKPPGNVIAQVGKHLKAMLTEGIDPDDVRRGFDHWAARGLHPSTLPSVVNELMNATVLPFGRASPGNTLAVVGQPRPSTTDQRVNAALAVANQFRETA